ncbi:MULTISPECIES: DUF998 domain-containing protein [Kitasatospora]|uniref:DUF998 domain-containing protein n=1 Tax=Kitasatospora cystarginea TaxID=58350 RepID=A0ABN3EQ57_9ACTN
MPASVAARPPARPLSAGVRRIAAAGTLAVASMVYNDWVLQFFLPTGLDQRDSYVSELFAADQPYRVLFSLVEVVCAGLITGGAVLARGLFPGRLAAAGCACLAALGVFSVADVLLPMRCAPSIEHGCPEGNPWHTTTSGLVHLVLFASMALFIAAARYSVPSLTLVRRWAPWLLPVSMAAAIATTGPFLGHPGGHGLAQRIHLVTAGVWFALLAAEAGRARAGSRPQPAAEPGVERTAARP